MELDLNQWKSPTKEYRGKPFWVLNGKLEKEELKFQIECMKKWVSAVLFYIPVRV